MNSKYWKASAECVQELLDDASIKMDASLRRELKSNLWKYELLRSNAEKDEAKK